MDIGILTLRDKYTRGSTIWYPLIKWEKKFFKDEGITFSYYKKHTNKEILNEDVVIIDSRYCRQMTVLDELYDDLNFIKNLINNLKRKNIKVLLFDNSDSGGGRYFDLIEIVDLYIKKQVLKNRNIYTENKGIHSYRVFLEGYKLSEETQKTIRQNNYAHVSCPKDQLGKIKLGWNIGMEDYRYFPFRRFYPIGTTGLLNRLYKSPNFNTQYVQKSFASSFRGTINKEAETYAFQRNKVIELFNQLDSERFITGDKVGKGKYLRELKNTKVCVSPFGWGEVCFRDFESIICGCVLLKPEMSHIETYPDIYKEGKTYVPLQWDMSDLEEKLTQILENYDEYIEIIQHAQRTYKNAILNFSEFRNRFMSLVT